MKVAVTFDLSDAQLVAIGLAETGKLQPAKRTECRDYITNTTMAGINTAASITTEIQKRAANEVREALGMPTVAEFGTATE